MKKVRGFRLKHRVITLFRFISRRNGAFSWYRRVDPTASKAKTVFRLFGCLKTKAKTLCYARLDRISGRAYVPLEDDDDHRRLKEKVPSVPKGHMAVYVGQKEGDFHRFLVPVIYFNHPLFGDLLREAEEEFGFNHPGGITIPCRISEFERVQTRIAAAGRSCRKFLTWKKTS